MNKTKKKERGKLLKLRDRLFTSSRWHEECLNISYSEIHKDVPSNSDRFKIQGGKKRCDYAVGYGKLL